MLPPPDAKAERCLWALLGLLAAALGGCDEAAAPHADGRVCSAPFPLQDAPELRAAVTVAGDVVTLEFPLHVVGSYDVQGGAHGLPEAVTGELLEPGAPLALNSLSFPRAALPVGPTVELAAGDDVRLEGFLTAELVELAAGAAIPSYWDGSFREDMCRRSCSVAGDGAVLCGVNWMTRYTLAAPGSEARIGLSAFGTDAGDTIGLGITGVLRVAELAGTPRDCCTGVRIELHGTVGEDGVVALSEYCADPWDIGCRDGPPGFNLRTDFHCRDAFDSETELLDACWQTADGKGPQGH